MGTRTFLALLVASLLTGCGTGQEPEDWVMSPDSFGPVTVNTSKADALATGAFQRAPSPCSSALLDWHTQTYRQTNADDDQDGKPDQDPVKAGLPTLYLRGDGKTGFEFIDPGKHTETDRGIMRGDSFAALKKAYGDDLIAQSGSTSREGAYAVNGRRSHLLFSVNDSRVDSYFIARGTVKGPDDFLIGRGGLC